MDLYWDGSGEELYTKEADKYELEFGETKLMWIYLWLHCNEDWESLEKLENHLPLCLVWNNLGKNLNPD